jgi:photosystem II stability/assembly factor-like uncharacterized protein
MLNPMARLAAWLGLSLLTVPLPAATQPAPRPTSEVVAGLSFRHIGPAISGGRVSDIAIDRTNRNVWYVTLASGGVWKTENAGTTWRAIFDGGGSYSIGVVVVDPRDPRTVWLGTGENTGQRSVGFGDGVYRSDDGGSSWRRVGLERSEHIGRILIDARDSDIVYVAAQGPLWAPGGDRGLYRTTDGGRSWTRILHVSDETGISDVVQHPRNPDVLLATSYQRRRHTGMQIAGGPEAGIYRSADGGATWDRISTGLPTGDVGRSGLAFSPQNPDVAYAVIAASGTQSGFYRSADAGMTWTKMSDYVPGDPQYYMELFPDPRVFDRLYSVAIQLSVTEDGGRTWRNAAAGPVHVDHHAMAFDPLDPDVMLLGNDGGLYQSFDGGSTWRWFDNLSAAQYYRIDVDDARPFYHVYGGTQDNGSLMGPSATTSSQGVLNLHWRSIGGGDGMQPRADPNDPDIVYVQSQNGAITRLDLRTNESASIRPPREDGEEVRWGWDSPLIVSPHGGATTRLYFAGSRLYRSDDRGASWTAVSPDLTRRLDRDTMRVMGRVWGADAVGRHLYTTALSIIVSLAESPLQPGLLYAGTDEGLIQITENGGAAWRAQSRLPGVPEYAYVSDIEPSRHDADVVYASFHHYQYGDFTPYILRSDDRGRTWRSIAGNLPARHVVWSIAEDHENPDVLFAGTEFGLFFTLDGGRDWIRLDAGLPTIMVRDVALQRRVNDLVAGTFGRGIYILDDYAPLRHLSPAVLAGTGTLLPVRTALAHARRGITPGSQGHGMYAADNPPYGALLTYFLGSDVPAGDTVAVRIRDDRGTILAEVRGPSARGVHRVAWNLRPQPARTATGGVGGGAGGQAQQPPEVPPGTYTAQLVRRTGGTVTPLGEVRSFEVRRLF